MRWTHQLAPRVSPTVGRIALAIGLSACSMTDEAVRVLYVAAETVECVGVAPQTCLLVRQQPDDPWELFYDEIEGFNYELGTEYVLEIEVGTVTDPPVDGSSLRYRLVRIVSARRVDRSASDGG